MKAHVDRTYTGVIKKKKLQQELCSAIYRNNDIEL